MTRWVRARQNVQKNTENAKNEKITFFGRKKHPEKVSSTTWTGVLRLLPVECFRSEKPPQFDFCFEKGFLLYSLSCCRVFCCILCLVGFCCILCLALGFCCTYSFAQAFLWWVVLLCIGAQVGIGTLRRRGVFEFWAWFSSSIRNDS